MAAKNEMELIVNNLCHDKSSSFTICMENILTSMIFIVCHMKKKNLLNLEAKKPKMGDECISDIVGKEIETDVSDLLPAPVESVPVKLDVLDSRELPPDASS